MDRIMEKFSKLGVDNAPGQEIRQKEEVLDIRGEELPGVPVDFSHGDVDAFKPTPGAFEAYVEGFQIGGKQAYTEYRGKGAIREEVAARLSEFTGITIHADQEIIITPGTQGALFLAMGSLIARDDKVSIVEPDYFANRKLAEFFEGELVPVRMHYEEAAGKAGLDLEQLEKAFQSDVKLFLFSNPNNPTGVIYSEEEIKKIVELSEKYNVALIVDELYSRQIFDERAYTHLCKVKGNLKNMVTIIGPSKTESLSGFRLGVAFGDPVIIARMEKLQAIVSLRAAGYSQSVLKTWFAEPEGFMKDRISAHQAIRDELLEVLRAVPGVSARTTEGGSYLFVTFPEMDIPMAEFIKVLRKLANVTVTPGTEFGPYYTNSFRINFSQDHKAAVDAIKRTLMLMERYRKK